MTGFTPGRSSRLQRVRYGRIGHSRGRYSRHGVPRQLVGVAIFAGVAGAAALLVFNGLVSHHNPRAARLASAVPTTSDTGTTTLTTLAVGSGAEIGVGNDVQSMVQALLPGIVTINVAGQDQNQVGTGFVVRPDGIIATTSSLVGDATTITVTSSDGQEWDANLVGTDPATGAALISVPASGLSVLPVDSSSNIQVGELSMVVCANSRSGSPYQASIGLFKGVDQQVNLDKGTTMLDAIVTDDTPPNPTGGVILDDQGRVVGMVQAVVSRGVTTEGVAVPISAVTSAADRLISSQGSSGGEPVLASAGG